MFAFADNDVDVAYFLPAVGAILPPTNLALLVRSRYAMYRILKISYDIKKKLKRCFLRHNLTTKNIGWIRKVNDPMKNGENKWKYRH